MRLGALLAHPCVQKWRSDFNDAALLNSDGAYAGDAKSESETRASVLAVQNSQSNEELVNNLEDFILKFCGFCNMSPSPAEYLTNGIHFQYETNIDKLMSTPLPLPAEVDSTPYEVKSIFDEATVFSAELLLRVVVKSVDGSVVVANPFSPGAPMGKLLKLPLLAQLHLVLINAVEAEFYQKEMPAIPMAINLYASILEVDSPVLDFVGNAEVVEIMEMTKGAKRAESVAAAASTLQQNGRVVLLDDFDASHPARDCAATGVKSSVFATAFHALQVIKNDRGDGSALLPFEGAPLPHDAASPRAMNVCDYYGALVATIQPGARTLIVEGSENCIKSEVQPGPPLNYSEPRATLAVAHVYRAAALTMIGMAGGDAAGIRILQQGGRALYTDEAFDEDIMGTLASLGKPLPAAQGADAGTMAWLGTEAARRVQSRQRTAVCGVTRIDVDMAAMGA